MPAGLFQNAGPGWLTMTIIEMQILIILQQELYTPQEPKVIPEHL